MNRITLENISHHLRQLRPQRITEPDTIEAAVAIVLAELAATGPELLLIKRAEHEGDPWSGQMALPGGRREPLDENLLQTARREALEETGVELKPEELLGELDDLHPRTRVLPPIVVRPFVFGLRRRPKVTESDEVHLHLWVPLNSLRDAGRQSRITLRDRVLEVPSYVVGPHVIWGMTERILKPIIEL
jgi:8-oxo-dGTP pyrophosphatase MutT (NUDIX family)